MSLWFDQSSDNVSRLKPGVVVSDPNALGKIYWIDTTDTRVGD
jgi:hypothetical protein